MLGLDLVRNREDKLLLSPDVGRIATHSLCAAFTVRIVVRIY